MESNIVLHEAREQQWLVVKEDSIKIEAKMYVLFVFELG